MTHGGKTGDSAPALIDRSRRLDYGQLTELMRAAANGFIAAGMRKGDRIGIYLPKQIETVVSIFATAHAGGVFVPVNPLLKPAQVQHILTDCDVRILVTSRQRAQSLETVIADCPALEAIVLVDELQELSSSKQVISWDDLLAAPSVDMWRIIDADVASILYTSGSTGKPKGVVLSHKNMVTGAFSVSEYLENTASDKLLAVLPFSFDYGFSQLTTAFCRGASVVLMEYLLPRDVIRKVCQEEITGLAGVPPLWNQLAGLPWPETATDHLRYWTNSGGAMPQVTLESLRTALPKTDPVLMYGLTEAFRSTWLPPAELDKRHGSMGKAIPNAEIMVVNDDGGICAPDEIGELVHRGSLVSLGYWNNPEKTAARFKPAPHHQKELVMEEIAVWSGDRVRCDEDGYLYFVGRRDEMIKTSGYRVSPNEVEEALFATGMVSEAVALGTADKDLGEAIVAIVVATHDSEQDTAALSLACRQELANFMLPKHIIWVADMPRNANGKIDRAGLAQELPALLKGLQQ
ncbi:MAG: acyl-CoA ligase (AMP-forming), exosortase A system-associated [Gammaproteobacteria bacterium]|nr:acyl-CoA ligase (AMP-forming), exosortase A system-associated [Gammaproteobacteria bacterium]